MKSIIERAIGERLQVETSRPDLRWIVLNGGTAPGSKVVCLCWIGKGSLPRVIVKFVRQPEFNSRIEDEYRALVELDRYLPPGPPTAPGFAGSTSIDGLFVGIETALPGRPLRTYLHEHHESRGRALESQTMAVNWITQLASRSTRRMSEPELQTEVFGRLEKALANLNLVESERAALAGLRSRAAELAGSGTALPTVFAHNDLGTPNVLVDKAGRFEGVVDWESGGAGLPATDLIYFLGRFAYEVLGAGGGDELRGYRELFFGTPGAERSSLDATLASKWLRDYCAAAGFDPGWLSVIFALCWIMHALNEQRQRAEAVAAGALLVSGVRHASRSLSETHFLDHLRFYLANLDRFAAAMGLDSPVPRLSA